MLRQTHFLSPSRRFGIFSADRVSLHDTVMLHVSSNVRTIQPMHAFG
jgi:hypothetical protein